MAERFTRNEEAASSILAPGSSAITDMHYNTNRYRKRVSELKRILGGACGRCGSTTRLEFHHRNPIEKHFDITSEFDRPWETLVEEARKCDLLCHDCHRKQHPPNHGLTMYTHYRCRCDICKDAWSQKMKVYKAAYRKRLAEKRKPS